MNLRARALVAASSALLLGALGTGVLLAGRGTWDPWLLGLLLLLVLGAELWEIHLPSGMLHVSGNLLGLVVAMALLGPSQAALIACISSLVWLVRARPRLVPALMTSAAFAWFPLVGAIVMDAVGSATGVTTSDLSYIGPVALGFVAAHLINVGLVVGGAKLLDGVSFVDQLKTVFLPLLPSEAAMVLLAGLVVYAQTHLGSFALALLVAVFFLYLHLYRELLLSQQRGRELTMRTEQLASLQVGVLTAMLRTLAMRDHMTARHSAAVARYTRAIAEGAGLSAEEQDLAHTAGLLHDIGKFILPDHILLADVPLQEADWQLIKMHPYQGAKVVREVEGYGPVADIIWCHHERMDGTGYPRRVAGEDIPLISRMISIADTYDVMTSRDSYRNPVSSAEAIAELRRVSGTQLDGRLVDIFIAVLEDEDLAFQHTDDTDFENELAFERRVRDYAAPPAPTALPEAA